jgi:hypothetical protein
MIICHKNRGTYIQYIIHGASISFRDGELTVNLAEHQRDFAVHLDISENPPGRLVLGQSHRYLAEIDLPPREYRVIPGENDDLGFPRLYKTDLPLTMEKVRLTLWALEV